MIRNALSRLTHAAQRPVNGSAAEDLLARLWPPEKVQDPPASLETGLADLLRTMRDESLDVQTRIKAAEAALRIKDAQSLTIEIVRYADEKVE